MGVSGSTTGPDREIRHHLSVDVEEYYQVSALEPYLPRERWPEIESRLHQGMARLLDLLEEFDTRSTFFVLGCVAEKHPRLIRDLAGAGHEIASHGWDHQRVSHLSPEEFRTQVRNTRTLLEDLSGTRVDGFRAPSFSITRGQEWALEIVREEGHTYDSSLYPVRRPGYGYAGGERGITTLELEAGTLVEVPPATLRVAGANLPVGGGGSLRHLPLALVRAALTRYGRNGGGATLYLHPWELDPDQPRVEGASWLTRLRHYGGLRNTEPRLRRLLSEFRFQPIHRTLAEKELL